MGPINSCSLPCSQSNSFRSQSKQSQNITSVLTRDENGGAASWEGQQPTGWMKNSAASFSASEQYRLDRWTDRWPRETLPGVGPVWGVSHLGAGDDDLLLQNSGSQRAKGGRSNDFSKSGSSSESGKQGTAREISKFQENSPNSDVWRVAVSHRYCFCQPVVFSSIRIYFAFFSTEIEMLKCFVESLFSFFFAFSSC